MSLLRGKGPQHPDPAPLELDDRRVVAAGTALWLLGLVGLLVAALAGARVSAWWFGMCLYGIALGLIGLRLVARRSRRRR